MGNTNNRRRNSSANSSNGGIHKKSSSTSMTSNKCFLHLTEGRSSLTESDFERVFGVTIGSVLWKDTFAGSPKVDEDTFSKHYYDLSNIQSESCIKLFSSVEEFLDACLSTAGKELKSENHEFVAKLVHDANKEGSVQFFSSHCPSLAQNTIVRHIRNAFNPSSEQVIFSVDSAVLSPLQMLLLQGSLSEIVYFKNKQASTPCWSKLYESHAQGLSVNRFEATVFGYSSPTVALFKLTNGTVYSIATNTEWKHTTKFLGSTLSKCIQFEPSFNPIESRHEEPIICNFKYRSAVYGLGFRDVFTITGEFDNVEAIEVYGCGSETSTDDQKALKQRQQSQHERNQKVASPEWEQDKAVLELAGRTFASEHERHSELHSETASGSKPNSRVGSRAGSRQGSRAGSCAGSRSGSRASSPRKDDK